MRRAALGAVAALAALASGGALAQQGPVAAGGQALGQITPTFTIWDVHLGQPVSSIPDAEIVNVACGTNGGPPSLPLANFTEFARCPAEASGLHEVYFEYDDEQTYIAKALELQDRYLQAGTSIYAHPVIISALVDDAGIARGIRAVTDDRASAYDRRSAASLATNLRARFSDWGLHCQQLPPAEGESAVGRIFIHDLCSGADPTGKQRLRLESRYMRLKGQTAINPETQQVIRNNFQSSTRFELVEAPYEPAPPLRASLPLPAPASDASE